MVLQEKMEGWSVALRLPPPSDRGANEARSDNRKATSRSIVSPVAVVSAPARVVCTPSPDGDDPLYAGDANVSPEMAHCGKKRASSKNIISPVVDVVQPDRTTRTSSSDSKPPSTTIPPAAPSPVQHRLLITISSVSPLQQGPLLQAYDPSTPPGPPSTSCRSPKRPDYNDVASP